MNLVESDTWLTIQLPIAEEFPVSKGNELVSCWADRFTDEFIKESFNSYKELGKADLWFQEHMLVIAPSEGLLYNMDNIKRYKSSDMRENLSKLTYYVSIDLAVSEKTTADYTAISVIGVNENNHWFLVDGFYGRVKPDETIDKLFMYVAKYRPYAVVFERVAFQMAMKTFIENEMVKRGIFFNLEMVSRTTQKLSVLKSFQPIIELGRFWVPDDIMQNFVEELLGEMSMITNDKILARHDDLIDSIAQLTLINVIAAAPISYDTNFDTIEAEINPYIF
jgi:predicted phage terminase large subunit-like protein